ncbi:MAG: DUF6798 domain-containing protein [Acidobacteriota bacterium]
MSRLLKAAQKNRSSDITIAALCVIAASSIIMIFNGGISVGYSNHTGLLPVVRRLLNPDYLSGDFNIQLRFYHHRIFAMVIASFTKLFGEDNALILLTVMGFTLLAASIYYLCRVLNFPRWSFFALISLIATNLAWVGRGLETNTFVGNREINPPTFAHAFVLFSLALVIQKRLRWAAFFAGLTILFHLQIGIAWLLILMTIFLSQVKSLSIKDWFWCGLLFLIPAVLVFPDVLQMFSRGLVNLPFNRADIDFRQPHHFELASTKAAIWVGIHFLLTLLIYWFLRKQKDGERQPLFFITISSMMIMAISILHFLDYYLLNLGWVMKTQGVRISVFIPVFSAFTLLYFLNDYFQRQSKKPMIIANLAIILVALTLYAIPSTRQGVAYSFGIRRLAEQKSEWLAVCNWVRENTPTDALFVTPPAVEGFTYLTNRSNIGEFKINPDGPQFLSEWYERLTDIAGGELPKGKGFANNSLLNRAYAGLDEVKFNALVEKYQVTYAVLPKASAIHSNVVFENNGFKVMQIRREGN